MVSKKKYSVLRLLPKIAHEGHVLRNQEVCSTSVFFCTISLLPSFSNLIRTWFRVTIMSISL